MSQLLIRHGRCVNPSGAFEADVLVEGGQIVAIGTQLDGRVAKVIDAGGKLVLPGGIDVHVHLPWPTGNHISTDDFSSGTQAAACGGVTTVIDFVIPNEHERVANALERKLSADSQHAWVDFSYHVNLRGDIDKDLADVPGLVARGFPSFKVFMAYEGFWLPDPALLRVMQTVAGAGGLLGVHAENGLLADYLTADLAASGRTALSNYPRARDAQCEVEAIHRILCYAETLGARLHVHHVSTASGAELIGAARRRGVAVTGETCPQYLLFTDDAYRGDLRRAAHLVCAPPIRTAADQAALWRALESDSLSMVATDHCPYTRQQKEANLQDLRQVPGGMGGVETRLPLVYSEGVVKGRLTLERFVETWATAPARAFGLYPRKGIIAAGSDADLVILDPEAQGTLCASALHMNTDCLAYEGWPVHGWPVTTILRGEVLVEAGRLVALRPGGALVRRSGAGPSAARS